MSYKYFGRLAGRTNASTALPHTTPPNAHTPFDPQSPATKFMAYGEDSTSLAFNRVMSAISTNLDYFAGILDSPSLREDLLTPRPPQAASSGNFNGTPAGFTALNGFHGNSMSLGLDGAANNAPPTWVFVGVQKAALHRHIKAYRKQPNEVPGGTSQDSFHTETFSKTHIHDASDGLSVHIHGVGTLVYSPSGVKIDSDGATTDYFTGVGDDGNPIAQTLTGTEHHALPNWIPPIQEVKADLTPYNKAAKQLKIKAWAEDGPIIGGDDESLEDFYVRQGCFLRIINAPSANVAETNNGLYRVAHISKSQDVGAVGLGEKVVLTRGGLHKVTVETTGAGPDFSAGDLIYWNARPNEAQAASPTTAQMYAYIAHIESRPDLSSPVGKEKKDLYLAEFGGSEEFFGSNLGTKSGIVAGVASMNNVGFADQELGADHHWFVPNGTVLYSANTVQTAVTEACIPASYPVQFHVNVSSNGFAVPHAPLGFILNPTLTFDDELVNGDYYVQCRTLTTVKERLLSSGLSATAFTTDDPTTKIGFTESDEKALTAFTRFIKHGPWVPDEGITGKAFTWATNNHNTVITNMPVDLAKGFTATRQVVGGQLWRLTLANSVNNALKISDEASQGDVLYFQHPDEADDFFGVGLVVSVQDNDLVLFGGYRFGESTVKKYWADPIVVGSSLPSGAPQAFITNAGWAVQTVVEAPYNVGIDGDLTIPSYGLNAAYHAEFSTMYRGPGTGYKIFMAPNTPVTIMMPGDTSNTGAALPAQTALSIRGDDVSNIYYLLHKNRVASLVHGGLRQYATAQTIGGAETYNVFTGGLSKSLEFRDTNSGGWLPLTSTFNSNFEANGLEHLQDRTILGGLSGAILGGTGLYDTSLPGGGGANTTDYSCFSTGLIAGGQAFYTDSDPAFNLGNCVFSVLGTKYECTPGGLAFSAVGELSYVYMEFGPSEDGQTQRATLKKSLSAPGSFLSPYKVYLYRVQYKLNGEWVIVADLRCPIRNQDTKTDLYVGGKLDNPSSAAHDPRNRFNTQNYDSASGAHFKTLRQSFDYVREMESGSNWTGTWPQDLEAYGGTSEHKGRKYTIHVVSDTYETSDPTPMTIPVDGIHIIGHLPSHSGGIPFDYDVTSSASSLQDNSQTPADHYDKDSRAGLPTIIWSGHHHYMDDNAADRNTTGHLINFNGKSGVVIENLSFKWEPEVSISHSGGVYPQWDVDAISDPSPNFHASVAGELYNTSNPINNRPQTSDRALPSAILFVNVRAQGSALLYDPLDVDPSTYRDNLRYGTWYSAAQTNDYRPQTAHKKQAGSVVIRNVSLTGGSGFLWWDSVLAPSYDSILIENCTAHRVVDCGVHIRGGSGQSFAAHNGVNNVNFTNEFSQSPHGEVTVKGCHFTQYGFTTVHLTDLNDATTTSYRTWLCNSTKFSTGIHVSCAKKINIIDNIIDAEMFWQANPQFQVNTTTFDDSWWGSPSASDVIGLGHFANSDADQRAYFTGSLDTPHTAPEDLSNIAENQLLEKQGSYVIVKVETSGANTEAGIHYVAPARPAGFVQRSGANLTFSQWGLEIPKAYMGTGMFTDDGTPEGDYYSYERPLYAHPDFGHGQGYPFGSPGTLDFYIGHFNFWRAGIEVGLNPTVYEGAKWPGVQGLNPAKGTGTELAPDTAWMPQGTSQGSPYMPVRSYEGHQDVVISGNTVTNTYLRGIFAQGTKCRVTENNMSVFAAASRLYASPSSQQSKAAISVDTPFAFICDNIYTSKYLGAYAPLDAEFENRFVEHPSIGAPGQALHVNERPIYCGSSWVTRYGGTFHDAISYAGAITANIGTGNVTATDGPGYQGQFMISRNVGFGVIAESASGQIINNTTQGGSITVVDQYWAGDNQSVLINGNILGASFRSVAGDIFSANPSPTSSIVTDNNLQSIDRLNDGTISDSFDPEFNIVQHNLPFSVNKYHGSGATDVFRMGAIQPFAANPPARGGSATPWIDASAAGWGWDDAMTPWTGPPNIPECFNGYSGPIHWWAADQIDGVNPLAYRNTPGFNSGQCVLPSMWLFGNSFPSGHNMGGGGACHTASLVVDPDFSNFGLVDTNEPFGFGEYFTTDLSNTYKTAQYEDHVTPINFFERRPYWLIHKPSVRVGGTGATDGLAVVPMYFTTSLKPRVDTTVLKKRLSQITINLKWVKSYIGDDGLLGYADSAGLSPKGWQWDNGNFGVAVTKKLIDDNNYILGALDTVGTQFFGVRAFIRKAANGQLIEVGQFIAHNMHSNLVLKGTQNGADQAGVDAHHHGVFLDRYTNRDGEECHETDNVLAGTDWLNNGKVARTEDGFSRNNLGMRHFAHDAQLDGGGNIHPGLPGISANPNPRTAAKESVYNHGTSDCGYVMLNLPSYVSSGSVDENHNYLDDGFVDCPLSMRLREFDVTEDAAGALGSDVDRLIEPDDTIEFKWYTFTASRNYSIFDIRVSHIKVEYEEVT